MKRLFLFISFVLITFAVSAFSPPDSTEVVSGDFPEFTVAAIDIDCNSYQTTFASWYGGEAYQHKPTASTEIFDENLMTAASNTIEFGTVVKVSNIENNKSVIVKINDVGAFKKVKIAKNKYKFIKHPLRGIDLSKAAFAAIADLKQGVIQVRLCIE